MIENKYLLAMMVAKRAKELHEGAKSLVETKYKLPIKIALEEIKAGKVYLKEEEEPLNAEQIFDEVKEPEKSEDISDEVEEPEKSEELSGEVKKPAKVKKISDEVKKPGKSKG
jgi:DNA-directed RNA polymerase omega subunit